MGKYFCLKTSAIWRFIGYIIFVIKIMIPLVIIILGIINLSKCVVSGKDDEIKTTFQNLFKKIVVGIIIFFIPTITKLVFSLISEASKSMEYAEDCISCLTAPLSDVCKNAVETDAEARKTQNEELYNKFYEFVHENKKPYVDYSDEKSGGNPEEILDDSNSSSGNALTGEYTSGSGTCDGDYSNETQSAEPNPANVIACHSNIVLTQNFVYPTLDGKKLGAWPVNYKNILDKVKIEKRYGPNNSFIMPVTSTNGLYLTSYDHGDKGGIDFSTYFGNPIYSPISGSLYYSTWGHTTNKRGGESAYSVYIKLDNPVDYSFENKNGERINWRITGVFMTHLSGLIYRCDDGICNKHIQQGDLIGFAGSATGLSNPTGWAPHLHIGFVDENGNQMPTIGYEHLYGLLQEPRQEAGK